MVENDLEVFSIRLPKEMGETIKKLAEANRRSRNGQIVTLLEQAVDLHKARSGKGALREEQTLRA